VASIYEIAAITRVQISLPSSRLLAEARKLTLLTVSSSPSGAIALTTQLCAFAWEFLPSLPMRKTTPCTVDDEQPAHCDMGETGWR
jgi:hypothetical protein